MVHTGAAAHGACPHLIPNCRPPSKAYRKTRRTHLHCEIRACTDQTRLRSSQSRRQTAAMVTIKQAGIALHIVAVLMAVTAVATACRSNHGSNRPVLGFVGPSIAPGLIATRSDPAAVAAAAKKCGLAKAPGDQQQSTTVESPLARRILLRRARSRPTSTATAASQRQPREVEARTSERGGRDIGDLFRLVPPSPQQRVQCSCSSWLCGTAVNATTKKGSHAL